jgi:hypothetical protein
MKNYTRDVAGLVAFYGDRIMGLRTFALVFSELGLPDLYDFLIRQAEANNQIFEWSQQLLQSAPDANEDPGHYMLWIASYRLLRRHAAVFCDHRDYWQGWHPGVEPENLEGMLDDD